MSAKRFSAVLPWPRAVAYAIAAVVMGVVVGELLAMLIFAGSSDRRLDEQAARTADTAPAVISASADLQRTRQARTALDDAVVDASRQRDSALVVARCEANPSAACPQTHITGVPGAGPEHRTADEFLADMQAQLDKAVVERDRLAPSLDAAVADDEQKVAQARDAAIATADRGFGARWLAMNAHTLASPAATALRALLTGLFIALLLFPLLLRLSRAKTTEDRRTAAIAAQERADLEADTAIAVKKAEVRAAIETMRAEQELASARMEIEAQNEIDREEQRRRVTAAIEAPTQVTSERVTEVVAELESPPNESVAESDNLPALTESATDEKRSLIPALPDVAGAAVRWMRPFVPPVVASAIETTTRPLRAARQVYEETEEIHFSLRRSHRVSVTEETAEPDEQWIDATPATQIKKTKTTRIDRPKPQARTEIHTSGGRRQLPSADS